MFINNVYLTHLICKDARRHNNYINILKENPKNVKDFLLKNYLICLKYIIKVLCMTHVMYNFYKNLLYANGRKA